MLRVMLHRMARHLVCNIWCSNPLAGAHFIHGRNSWNPALRYIVCRGSSCVQVLHVHASAARGNKFVPIITDNFNGRSAMTRFVNVDGSVNFERSLPQYFVLSNGVIPSLPTILPFYHLSVSRHIDVHVAWSFQNVTTLGRFASS